MQTKTSETKRSPTEDISGVRKRKRRKMNASTQRRDGDREMQPDAELISPIQRVGEPQESPDNASTTLSEGGRKNC